MLRIGIIGTRGIPNRYGGFEQLAQYLSAGLVAKGHEVFVYNTHDHPYAKESWEGVNIIHCYNPENLIGTAGQFVYDLNCTIDARKRKFDLLLILGYTSSSVWGWLYPKATVCINHMDGLEWKRSKYNWFTKQFLRVAERLALQFSSFYIADSPAIRTYLSVKYHVNSVYIAYGADIVEQVSSKNIFSVIPYYLLIARMEKENNIEMILDGMHNSGTDKHFLVMGNTDNRFGKYLVNKYQHDKRIVFMGAIYDQAMTASLKSQCEKYFHGHSVGGTNPSLLEAMAAGSVVCAHRNPFNQHALGEEGYYFSSADEVTQLIDMPLCPEERQTISDRNIAIIRHSFAWSDVIDQYEQLMIACYHTRHQESVHVYNEYHG